MLKLNDDKTEFLVIYTKAAEATISPCSVGVGDVCIQPSTHVRTLGVAFDSVMVLDQHVQNHLEAIGRIRRYLDVQSAKRLIQALVISRLDGCDSLLCGLPAGLLRRLPGVQNACKDRCGSWKE